MSEPGMIVLGGLPGTGKSSIAKPLARRLGAPFLRIDTIEQAVAESGELSGAVGVVGYDVAGRLAADQIRVGLSVVVECVNPCRVSRDAWRAIAEENRVWILEVETICSDAVEHRRRVEGRAVDVPGLVLPTWRQVVQREYEPWHRDRLVLDTSVLGIDAGVETLVAQVDAVRRRRALGD